MASAKDTKKIIEQLGKIQKGWSLSLAQMAALIHVDPENYSDWQVLAREQEGTQGSAGLGAQVQGGVESLVSIFNQLAIKFPKKQDQIRWLFAENKDFGGSKPIDLAMSSLDNLYWLNYYLSAKKLAATSAEVVTSVHASGLPKGSKLPIQ